MASTIAEEQTGQWTRTTLQSALPGVRKALVLLVVVGPFLATTMAVVQLWERAVSWRDLALLFGMYIPISLGVTAGFHRMLTHRSFRAHPVARAIILIFGSMAVEGAAISWAANHLKHHALADKEGDPHSPVDGLVHAHLGWLFSHEQADPNVYCRPLLRDPVVVFVHRTFGIWVVLSLLLPFAIGGWSGLLWGGLVRMFFVHHITWSVNSVCHTFGRRAFSTPDRSRNQWMVGLLGMGEGWHNNHHAFPRSAVHGLDRWQLDVSAWVIAAFERLGLATEVQRIPHEVIARKRLSG
ncbi:MAG: acyl-CoA desaturase [Chloroflexi bacterium]|nr:acyl-CoA desaturase [Chloroflexota bacterium]